MWNPSIVRTNQKWCGKRNFCCIALCSTFLSHWTQCTWTFLAKQKKTQQNKWNTEIAIISGQFSIELWQNRIRKLVHAILPTDFHFNVKNAQCMERGCVHWVRWEKCRWKIQCTFVFANHIILPEFHKRIVLRNCCCCCCCIGRFDYCSRWCQPVHNLMNWHPLVHVPQDLILLEKLIWRKETASSTKCSFIDFLIAR